MRKNLGHKENTNLHTMKWITTRKTNKKKNWIIINKKQVSGTRRAIATRHASDSSSPTNTMTTPKQADEVVWRSHEKTKGKQGEDVEMKNLGI